MILAVNLTISAILVVLSIVKRSSRFLFVLIFLWMWFLFSFNYGNADYTMYVDLYGGVSDREIEPGMNIIMQIFNTAGLSYHAFLAILSAVGLSLVAITITKRSKKNISLIAALYLIFPFVFDAIQIRNFIAMSLIIFGINYLIDRGKWWCLKYVIINIIAISFHSMSAVCLLFPLLVLLKKKTIWVATSIALLFGVIVSFNKSLLTTLLSTFLSQEKVDAYFGLEGRYSSPGIFNIILSIFILISLVLIVYYCKKRIKDIKDKKITESILLLEKISIVGLLLIPFLRYSTVIMRLARSMMLLYYIVFADVLFSDGEKIHRERDKNSKNDNLKSGVIAGERPRLTSFKKYSLAIQIVIVIIAWNYSFIFGIRNEKLTYGAVFGNNIVEEKMFGMEI